MCPTCRTEVETLRDDDWSLVELRFEPSAMAVTKNVAGCRYPQSTAWPNRSGSDVSAEECGYPYTRLRTSTTSITGHTARIETGRRSLTPDVGKRISQAIAARSSSTQRWPD